MRPLGIYVHIPFCVRKCQYCDFLSMPSDEEGMDNYISALIEELKGYRLKYALFDADFKVETIYLGGGTPSLLKSGAIKKLLECIFDESDISDNAEITIEANPGTVSLDKLRIYRECGINRLSLGLQSANENELRALGRIHGFDDFVRAYKDAKEAGFDNINVDVMTAIPGQTMDSLGNTLEKVTELNPKHISAYSLMLEEGTPLYDMYLKEKGPDTEAGDAGFFEEDEERAFYHYTVGYLEKKGYIRYEISNFARKGFESRHNTSYWTGREYLGLGLGASSLLENVRYKNTCDMRRYLQAPCSGEDFSEKTVLSEKDMMEEFMFLGLRMSEGVNTDDFDKRFGRDVDEIYGPVLDRLQRDELICRRENRISLTERGIDYGNHVFSEFIM